MDRLEAIERLAKLRDSGVLTESEFVEQKSIVMSATSIELRPAPAELQGRLERSQRENPAQYRSEFSQPAQIHIHNSNAQHNNQPVYVAVAEKSLIVSYLLWLFLGGVGGHRFYLGRPGSALLLLMLNVAGWATIALGIGLIFLALAGLWLFIDLFLIPGMANSRRRVVLG